MQCLLHERYRYPLAGTGVLLIVAAALRNEIERTPVPLPKSLRSKRLRFVLARRIVVRAVEVEQDPGTLWETVAVPLEGGPHAGR